MFLFEQWRKFKALLLKHEKVLWVLHSVWAFAFGILVIVFFHGDFGQVKKLTLYLMALLLLLIVFDRVGAYEKRSGKKRRGVKIILNYVMKNMYQGLYFFMLPFYWEASVLGSPNIFFTLVVAFLAVLSTQDLIFDNWLMEKKPLRAGFYALCLFASFNLLLPLFLPLPTRYTLVMAAFFATIGFVVLHYPHWILRQGHLRWVFLGSCAVAGLVYLLRGAIPPAPFKIAQTTVTARKPKSENPPRGDGVFRIHHRDMMEKEIYCVHVLESPIPPRGLFKHVWSRDDVRVHTKILRKLPLKGGKYLLWSSLKHAETGTLRLTGEWEVELFTSGGQILKKRSFLVVQ